MKKTRIRENKMMARDVLSFDTMDPKKLTLDLFDRWVARMPTSFILSVCRSIARPRPLRRWPGWIFGAGEYKTRLIPLTRILCWRAFCSKQHIAPFVLMWHYGIKVFIYPHVELCRSLFVTGAYEPNEFFFLNGILKPGMVFIDAGASLGLYSLFASMLVGEEGIVLAIEPSRRDFHRLKENSDLNQRKNIRLRMIGLSNATCDRELRVADEIHSGQNTLGSMAYAGVRTENRERIRVERLDDLILKEKLHRVDVIKMDTEGHELFVLQGARDTIQRFKPILVVELVDRSLSLQGCSTDQVWDSLAEMGYQILQFDPATGRPVAAERKPFYQENIIAIHKSRVEEL